MLYYRIKNMPGFEGLIVSFSEASESVSILGNHGSVDYAVVSEIINPNVAIGDSTLRWPQERGALLICFDNLEKVDYSPKSYTTNNPFGKFLYESHYKNEKISVDFGQYEKGCSVNLKNGNKTIFSQNFFGEFSPAARDAVQESLTSDEGVEDLVFKLRDIADAQKSNKPL